METVRRKHLNRLFAGVIALSSVCVMTGCGPRNAASQRPAAYGAKIVVIGAASGEQFWDSVQNGTKEAAEEFGYEVIYRNAKSNNDIDGQIQLVHEAIDLGAKAIVIAPNDPIKLDEVLQEAADKGIVVGTIDTNVDTENENYNGFVTYHIGSANASGGQIAARQAINFLQSATDKAAIIGHSEASVTAQQSVNAFRGQLTGLANQQAALAAAEAAKKAAAEAAAKAQQENGGEGAPAGTNGPNDAQQGGAPQGGAPQDAGQEGGAPQGEGQQGGAPQGGAPQGEGQQGGAPQGGAQEGVNPVLTVLYCNDDIDIAKAQALELLENSNVKVIYTTSAHATRGVCEAVDEMEMTGKVAVIGFNADDSEMNYIKSGTLTGTIIQNPYNIGYLGVFYAGRCINNERVSANVDTGITYVNKNNLKNAEIQLMLDPSGYVKEHWKDVK
ncbi:MAG: substrate-binding domain-containing protein [Oscillospiraceae bacterium]|nr:substrate-binding domain-containing protein [Oscillospiraceae bacterium]